MKTLSIIGLIISLLAITYGIAIAILNDNPEIRGAMIFIVVIPNLFFLTFSIVVAVVSFKKKNKQ